MLRRKKKKAKKQTNKKKQPKTMRPRKEKFNLRDEVNRGV